MRLTKARIAGFRSFQASEEIAFDPHLTILAGRNNVGKTATLLSLRLPIQMQAGTHPNLELEYWWTLSREELASLRLDLEPPLFGAVSGQMALNETHQLRVLMKPPPDWRALPPVVQNSNMNGAVGSLHVYEVEILGTPLRIQLGRVESSPGAIALWWPAGSPFNGGHARVVELLQIGAALLNRFFYLQPRRTGSQTMLFTPSIPPPEVAPDGSNLTNVIATIYTNDRLGSFDQLQAFTRSAFRDVDRIDVLMTQGPNATVNLVFGGPNGLVVPLEHCGTGIEQMLVLGSAVLTSTTDRIFLLDEPHAFLHPDAERSLIRFLDNHPRHQYVVATHSGVFLNAYPLSTARLVTLTERGSHVADVAGASEILTEVGVTAADLWSNDAILWVEGPSEQAIIERLMKDEPAMKDIAVRVAPMPDAVRAAARTLKTAEAVVAFCLALTSAVSPVKVQAIFLFDADEKSRDLKQRITDATAGQARFLEVRELENLFLSAPALLEAISPRCAEVGRPSPTLEQLERRLNEILAQTSDGELYRQRMAGPDDKRVVGSEVLQRLYWEWVQAEYDKVADGKRLLDAVIHHAPDRLTPLRDVLRDISSDVMKHRSV
jgi:hypothetical protein